MSDVIYEHNGRRYTKGKEVPIGSVFAPGSMFITENSGGTHLFETEQRFVCASGCFFAVPVREQADMPYIDIQDGATEPKPKNNGGRAFPSHEGNGISLREYAAVQIMAELAPGCFTWRFDAESGEKVVFARIPAPEAAIMACDLAQALVDEIERRRA